MNNPTISFGEPTLLPQPNHVMLNHLYALSIKVSNELDCIIEIKYITLGWSDGFKRYSPLPKEICHNTTVQANITKHYLFRFAFFDFLLLIDSISSAKDSSLCRAIKLFFAQWKRQLNQ